MEGVSGGGSGLTRGSVFIGCGAGGTLTKGAIFGCGMLQGGGDGGALMDYILAGCVNADTLFTLN